MMFNPVLLIAIPLGLAFMAVILKKMQKWILALGIIVNAVLVFFVEKGETAIGGFKIPFGISLVLDDFSAAGVILINILALAAIVIAFKKAEKFAPVILAGLAGMNGMILTGDLFNLFVFMEITAISAYILSSEGRKPAQSFNYLVIGSVGSVLYLLGLILLYNQTGTLNMVLMTEKTGLLGQSVLLLPILLIFAGIAVEAKLLPMAGWVKGVLGNSNAFTGVMFASVYSSAALFVFGRIFSQVLIPGTTLGIVIIIIALVTFSAGQASAFRSKSLRQVLLYSSIAQSGLAAALFATGFVFPAVLVVVNNAVGKMIMFSAAGSLEEKYGTDDYIGLGGAFSKNTLTGVAFSIAALSLTGLPLLFGFYAKLNVLAAYLNQGTFFVPAVILIGTIVEGAYFIKILIKLWAPGKEGEWADADQSVGDKKIFTYTGTVAVILAAILIVLSGLMPDAAGKLIAPNGGLLGDDGPAISLLMQKGGDQ
jgi:multicomponent Na+:H+ antiporter subunit D